MKVLITIPTYNEAENLPSIVERVRHAAPEVDILVVDDHSPDGTGDIADALSATDDHISVLHRAGKEGLGRAYVAAFGWAIERGYSHVVEMDADGSHLPEQLPLLLERAAMSGPSRSGDRLTLRARRQTRGMAKKPRSAFACG